MKFTPGGSSAWGGPGRGGECGRPGGREPAQPAAFVRAALAESIGFGLDRPYALVTYHPETAGGASPAAQFDALCAALERCGLAAVFTKANADAGGADINARIDAVCARAPDSMSPLPAWACCGTFRP
ncbi:MAG: hypothetical protein ACLVJ8_02855 [Ruthenibacterium lactatiformans]